MKPKREIAVFYHAKLTGPEFGLDETFSLRLVAEQMGALAKSLLGIQADHITYGFNEDQAEAEKVKPLLITQIPGTVRVMAHGPQARSELSTLHALQQWLPHHKDAYVCYFHAKGITHPYDAFNRQWRLCMESAVIDHWRECVADLDRGHDSVGAHWLTPERFGASVRSPFWGGNYWWAKARFLLTLPVIPPTSASREQDFLAENWIGLGPRRPRVRDYRPHWPGRNTCPHTLRCYLISP